MMKTPALLFCAIILFLQQAISQDKLKVVIAGLTHDHVNGTFARANEGVVEIIGIAEKDEQLCNRMKKTWHLPDSLFYPTLSAALAKKKPDLVMIYTSPAEHLPLVAACMPKHIPVMVEKPLAFSYTEALKIAELSKQFHTKVYTNYVSGWYTSFVELFNHVSEVGPIRRMVMHGGHIGPKEIGCSPDFLGWLTDPLKNGGGAITDFGCYGASILTAFMDGKTPISVYAITRHLKPDVYPKVDDDATILLEYPGTTGVIESSWSWPYTIMDIELYGKDACLHAIDPENLESKTGKGIKKMDVPAPPYKDELEYFTAVLKHGAPEIYRQMSIERNLIVVKILDAARKSAKEGKKIML